MKPLLPILILAAMAFAAAPAQAIESDDHRLSRLARELDDDDYAVREKATEALVKEAPALLIPFLDRLLEAPPSNEVKARALSVLRRVAPALSWRNIVDAVAKSIVGSPNVKKLVEVARRLQIALSARDRDLIEGLNKKQDKLSEEKDDLLYALATGGGDGPAILKRLKAILDLQGVEHRALVSVYAKALSVPDSAQHPVEGETASRVFSLGSLTIEQLRRNGLGKSPSYTALYLADRVTLIVGAEGSLCVRHGHSDFSIYYPKMFEIDSLAGQVSVLQAAGNFPGYALLPDGRQVKELSFPELSFEVIQLACMTLGDTRFPFARTRLEGEEKYDLSLSGVLKEYMRRFAVANRLSPEELENAVPSENHHPLSPTIEGGFLYLGL